MTRAGGTYKYGSQVGAQHTPDSLDVTRGNLHASMPARAAAAGRGAGTNAFRAPLAGLVGGAAAQWPAAQTTNALSARTTPHLWCSATGRAAHW